jgi:predicted transport protein
MIVLIDGVRYRLVNPENEDDLEKAIKSNSQHIFGPDSLYFDVKKLIKSKAGVASIPDGYVICFEQYARWCILEVELSSHSIYDHLVPQLTKFNRGIENSSSRKKLVEILYTAINENEVLKARLKQKIKTGEVYKFISDLISENPLIVVAIDKQTDELKEALRDIRGDVRVLEFQTFQREGITDQINAYVFEPVFTVQEDIIKDTILAIGTKQVTRRSRRGSIIHALYRLFDDKGVENVTYEECEALAKSIKPNTAFNKNHFSWYKRDYEKKSNATPHTKRIKGKEYGVEFHTRGKPQKIIELFNSIDEFCLNLDPANVQRSCHKKYIKYSHSGKILCSLHLWNSLIRIWLKLKYNDLEEPPDCVRDVTNIGHWGVGDVEVAIDSFVELETAKTLIQKSFNKNR